MKQSIESKAKKWLIGLNLVMVLIILTACGNVSKGSDENLIDIGASYQKITAEEAKERIVENPDALIVDVRTADEYAESHIEGALLIPNETIADENPELLPDKDAEILVYCRSGNRSRQAAEKLIAMGYTDVKDMGGIKDWPYDTVTGDGSGDGRFGDDERSERSGSSSGGADSGTKESSDNENEEPSLANFTTEDLNGNAVDEKVFGDYDLTLVNVWATFCGYCLKEMPELAELNDEFADDNFHIVGIVMDVYNRDGTYSESQIELAKEVADKTGADYPHLLPSEDLLAAGLYGIQSFPTSFFVDQNGNVIGDLYYGMKSKEYWEKAIREKLDVVKAASGDAQK